MFVAMFTSRHIRPAAIAAFAVIATVSCGALQAQTGFLGEVNSTQPLAFYRIDSTSGRSQVGASTYKASGTAIIADSGAPVLTANGRYLKLDGQTAYITTTQIGGIGTAASIMAWVNLAELPSKAGRLFYVAGESEVGNDFDVQFDTDNGLKFWTAAGGHISYTPSPGSLIGQWHQIVVTLDTATGHTPISRPTRPRPARRLRGARKIRRNPLERLIPRPGAAGSPRLPRRLSEPRSSSPTVPNPSGVGFVTCRMTLNGAMAC